MYTLSFTSTRAGLLQTMDSIFLLRQSLLSKAKQKQLLNSIQTLLCFQ